jgi:hypothetical protein
MPTKAPASPALRARSGAPSPARVGEQTYGQDVPVFPEPCLGRVQLGPQEGGEALPTVGAGVRDGESVPLAEVVRDGEEVVAGLPVEAGKFFRWYGPVRVVGVGMEVAPVEAPRLVEGEVLHERLRYHHRGSTSENPPTKQLELGEQKAAAEPKQLY